MAAISSLPQLHRLLDRNVDSDLFIKLRIEMDVSRDAHLDGFRRLMREHRAMKSFRIRSPSRGRLLPDVLGLLSESESVEEIQLYDFDQSSQLNYEALLPAVGRALRESQTIRMFALLIESNKNITYSQESWGEFVKGIYECPNLESITIAIPSFLRPDQIHSLAQALGSNRNWATISLAFASRRAGSDQSYLMLLHQIIRNGICVEDVTFKANVRMDPSYMITLAGYCSQMTGPKKVNLANCRVSRLDLAQFFRKLSPATAIEELTMHLAEDNEASPSDFAREHPSMEMMNFLAGSKDGRRPGNKNLKHLSVTLGGTNLVTDEIHFYVLLNTKKYRDTLHTMSPSKWCETLMECNESSEGVKRKFSFIYYILRHSPDRWSQTRGLDTRR